MERKCSRGGSSTKFKVLTSQPAFNCLKLTIETLEEGVKYAQS